MTPPTAVNHSRSTSLRRQFFRCHIQLALSLALALSCVSWVGATLKTNAEPQCLSMKTMGMEQRIKRYIIDNKHQVTLPLRIGYSDRISHRLTNAIFIKFIQEVMGYQQVELVHYNDTMNAVSLQRYFRYGEMRGIPPDLINLEVWIPSGFSKYTGSMKDRGSQGTGGRFGWYVSLGKSKDPGLILDHWRSYQDEDVVQHFALTPQQTERIKTMFTKDRAGNHYCPDTECTDGMFIPAICRTKTCATLFAGHFEYSSFLIRQVIHQKLYVQVAWIGPNLTPQFILKFREDDPILFFSWWPSPITVLDNLRRVAFPSCTDVNEDNAFLCRYEMHTLRKLAWEKLKEFGNMVYASVERFSLQEEDYRDILMEYNQWTMFDDSDDTSLLQPTREPGWDNHIIDAIACDWLNRTASSTSLSKILIWRPINFDHKPELWFMGIFPVNDSPVRYTSKTLIYAAQMAIRDVNRNSTILNDYSLALKPDNGACSTDEVLYAFIRFIRTKDLNINRLIGILGPSCSDTVEPLAGLAKMFNMIIISYSAEAITNDQEKYPYFFRTIPGNLVYRYVYAQLFDQLKWKHLASFTEDGSKYSEYLTLLQDTLQKDDITIFNKKFPREAPNDMASYLKSLRGSGYRITIGEFYPGTACEIMCEAFNLQMTATDGYVWFLPRWFDKKWYSDCNKDRKEPLSCSPEEMLMALDGHLSLGYSYYANDNFVYHSGETVSEWKGRHEDAYKSSPADYAGYTYDAVWAYAFALDKLLRENFTHAANLRSDATNSRFVQLLRQTNFNGVSGHISFPQGSQLRNSVVNIMQFRSNYTAQQGYYRIVGNFYPNSSMPRGGLISLNNSAIEWLTPDGLQPTDGSSDGPVCALEAFMRLLGVSCEFTIVITLLICLSIFACMIISCFFVYKIKFEKIEPPPWQLRNLMNLDEWEIPRDQVVMNRTIGAGAFGTVYGGECLINDESGWVAVAVKTLKKGSTAENKLDFLGEAEMMKRFNHKNIVRLIGLCTQVEPIYMIMEFMLYGDLQTYLLARRHLVSEKTSYNDDDEISNRRLTSMALDVANALEYLASNKYVHRDVASRNCLVNADRVVKLSDFGMTRPVYENNYYRFSRRGMLPVRWMAPESIEDGIYTTMTDVWSFGVLLYEIITFGNFPFAGLKNNEVLEHVVKHQNTLKAPKGIRPDLENILYRCWTRVPELRPTFSQLIEFLSSCPRLIAPCLEVPIASVQANDSDSFEIGIDPTRKVPVTKTTTRSNPVHPPPPAQEEVSPAPFVRRDSDTPSLSGIPHPGFNPSMLSGGSTSGTSRTRRNRTPVENGGGPTMEPLLPLTSDDSYITRYVCLQMNNKSPDGVDQESTAPEITSV